MAAAREGRDIPFGEVARFTEAAFAGAEDVILMEGVGGLMAPVGAEHTVLDWLRLARVPALLVVGGYLGTISHTLTAAKTLAAEEIPLAGIVISARGELPVPPEETADAIARFLPGVPIAIMPDLGAQAEAWRHAPDLLGPLGLAHTPA
jgi:dethiobiotin synthetase